MNRPLHRQFTIRPLIFFFAAWFVFNTPLVASAHGGEAHLELNTTQASPGTTLDLRGVGFDPEGAILIMLVGAERQLLLGGVSADEAGDFNQALSLPVDLLPGAYEVRAADSHHSASIPLNIMPPAGLEEEGEQRGEEEPLLAPMPTRPAGMASADSSVSANTAPTLSTPETSPAIPPTLVFSSALAIVILGVGLFVISRRSR